MTVRSLLACAALALGACESADTPQIPSGDVTELVVVDTRVGEGLEAREGYYAFVHYTGWLYDPNAENRRGAQFDTSRTRGRPFSFQIGAGRVIDGWDQGIPGMRVGGRRLLFIPPELGYGERGFGDDIPPNSALVFDVELVELRRP